MDDVALALFMGPALILAAVNAAYLMRTKGLAPIGQPVREAFPEGVYRRMQATMDEVYRTGRIVALQTTMGRLLIAPYLEGGRIVGVVTSYRADALALPRPAPRPLQLAGPRVA